MQVAIAGLAFWQASQLQAANARIVNNPHESAAIEATWTKPGKRGGRFADLYFSNSSAGGAIACHARAVRIGEALQPAHIGEHIEVAPNSRQLRGAGCVARSRALVRRPGHLRLQLRRRRSLPDVAGRRSPVPAANQRLTSLRDSRAGCDLAMGASSRPIRRTPCQLPRGSEIERRPNPPSAPIGMGARSAHARRGAPPLRDHQRRGVVGPRRAAVRGQCGRGAARFPRPARPGAAGAHDFSRPPPSP